MTLDLRCSLLQPIIQQQSPKLIANYQPMSSNTLYNMLETGSFTNASYNEAVAQTSGIWTAIAVITLAIYLILLSNAIWMRRCPHRASGIWAWCRLTKSQKHTTNFLVAGLVLCTIALGASIIGAMIGGSNRENGDKAACALIDFFGRVKNGSISDNWGGTEKSLLSYQTLAARFSTEVQGISATFSTDSSQVDSKIVEYQNDLLTLEKNRGNYKVKSARYGSTSSVETDFVHELLPMSKTGTHLNSLKAESNKISSVIKNSAQGLKTELPNLKSKVANYQISATKAADNYKTFIQPVSMASQSIVDYVTENYDAWTEVNTGVLVLFYINMALLTTLLASTLHRDKSRSQLAVKLAYISWNCLMILNVLNAILASHMQMLKKHSLEHCDVFNLIAKDPKYIEALSKQYTSESTAALKLCFFGNGDTYGAVGFSEAGQKLGKIGTYIRDIEPYLVNGPGSKEITAQKAIIDMYIQGLILPSSDQKSEESTITNLNLFNSYSNSIPSGNKQTGLAHCSISKDMWVLNLANCTTKRWIAAYEPYDNFGDSICLGILSLDSGNIDERYKDSNFPGCGLVHGDKIASILVNQYHGLNAHFEDARIKFVQLKRFYENNLELKYNETLKAARTITQPIQDFNTSFSGLLQYATSPEDGILYNSNCSFFRSGLRQTNSFLCEAAGSIDTTFTVQIISIVCGTLGCVLMYLYLRKLEATFKLIKDDEDSDWEKRGPKEMHRFDASNQEDNDQF